ncbi:MAG: hypothetical protein ACFNM8_05070, partial [Prevotella histicola]|uniref:hypothetical protein n=1 Tax=Prevotella histicola TaxID=470565 RepID=UPI0036237F5A
RENTIIGELGVDLSQGQKQRILIARDMYKSYLAFFYFGCKVTTIFINNCKIYKEKISSKR